MSELPIRLQRAQEIVENFSNKSVLVIGDMILDEFIWGSVERISPEAPVPVVEAKRRSFMPGGAANVARNLRDLNMSVSVIGRIGDDDNGQSMVELLANQNIDTAGIIRTRDRLTTIKTRVIGQHQQIVRIDWEDCVDISSSAMEKIEEYVKARENDLDAIIFEDYGKGVISQELVSRVMNVIKNTDICTAFDPKKGHFIKLDGVTVATPNHSEAFEAAGRPVVIEPSALDEVGNLLLKKWDVQSILITLGEHGMAIFEKGKPCHTISTVAREVYDVSGAGDTVIATLTASLVAGASLTEAAILSNHAAGVVVAKVGTASITQKEIIDAVKIQPDD